MNYMYFAIRDVGSLFLNDLDYPEVTNEAVKHQYYRKTRRCNRLLSVGHRCRGDVGVIAK